MVYISPPHLASSLRPSYAQTYNAILAAHRRSPLTAAASVIVLVAPDLDALCAARMLADLFKQDDVMHRIIPVCGMTEMEDMRDELVNYHDLHTLIMLNMGGMMDLTSEGWFGGFPEKLRVHVIDSSRPQTLANFFAAGDMAERVVMWDDGGVEKLEEQRMAWEGLTYEPDADSDEDSDEDFDRDQEGLDDEEWDGDGDDGDEDMNGDESISMSRKRGSLGDNGGGRGKRRRLLRERPKRMSRDQRDEYQAILDRHYQSGNWHGQSASGTIYVLANVMERVDNDLLWFAIMGLTYQYTAARIPRTEYDKWHSIYYDEVARLNPDSNGGGGAVAEVNSSHPDDRSIRAVEELRFMMFRHWNLYDAMYHSSYVASKMGIWKERGRKRLTGLLAKMGFSIPQTQQPYTHMDTDLKHQLRDKLEEIAPEYGLVELAFPSFVRCFGYRSRPLSAADTCEAAAALLDVAGGVRMEVEKEGARNGGEWFGGAYVWRLEAEAGWEEEKRSTNMNGIANGRDGTKEGETEEGEQKPEVQWWVRNFWSAYDSLDDITRMRDALPLAMSLHRAVIRQGTSIIDKQDIKTMRTHRLVLLTQGPDLALFAHPRVLSRLAMWLVDSLRDRLAQSAANNNAKGKKRRKNLPFVVACANEAEGTYIVVGVTGAMEFGDVRKNEFGLAFMQARERCHARTRYGSFDTSVLEINKADLMMFLEALTEAMDGPDY